MASPGRSWIVLFWTGRKRIVLLQLRPFSSPHRERPILVLMGLPKSWDRPALPLVWDRKTWIQLETVDTAKKQGTSELRGTSEPIRTHPFAAKWGTWGLKGLNESLHTKQPVLSTWDRTPGLLAPIPHYLFTTCICTSIGRNTFNAGRMSKTYLR